MPCYVNRGDPIAPDFTVATLTIDSNWHELDLSGIVPANATAVDLALVVRTVAVSEYLAFRAQGHANVMNMSQIYSRVAGINHAASLSVPIGSNGIIEYYGFAGAWLMILLTVKGWWT